MHPFTPMILANKTAPGIDNLLAMTVHTGAIAGTYYAVKDHLGTVHALTDGSGAVVESYRFDAWGNVLEVRDAAGSIATRSPLGNRYLWQGREYDWQSGWYYFRARWYDPRTGRWLSNDPIGISGGLNQYVFCANDPVNCRDPLGLDIYVIQCESRWSHIMLYVGDADNGYTVFSFMPATWNTIYGASDVIVFTSTDIYSDFNEVVKIDTTPAQDARAIQVMNLLDNDPSFRMPFQFYLNNCTHMARLVLNSAGVDVGNKIVDWPGRLICDVKEYNKKRQKFYMNRRGAPEK